MLHVSIHYHYTMYMLDKWEKVCAEQTKQTAGSCFGLVGPHQRQAALQRPGLTYPRQTYMHVVVVSIIFIHHKPHGLYTCTCIYMYTC